MKYSTEISKKFNFEAAHRLPFVPADHKCSRLHGHSFQATITVKGPIDPKMGWIVDFAEIKAAFEPLRLRLDHNYLNEIEGLENPTSENVALYIMQNLKIQGAEVSSVTVEENCTSASTVYSNKTPSN